MSLNPSLAVYGSQTLVYLEVACKVLGAVLGHGSDVLDYGLQQYRCLRHFQYHLEVVHYILSERVVGERRRKVTRGIGKMGMGMRRRKKREKEGYMNRVKEMGVEKRRAKLERKPRRQEWKGERGR